jgi:predicted lipoprotein
LPVDETGTGGRAGSVSPPPDAGGGGAGAEPDAGDFSRQQLLESFADCSLDQARTFLSKAEALNVATDAHASAPSNESAEAARVAWEAAIDQWQRLEVLQFGPSAPTTAAGGQGLRTQIYSWPTFNRCGIDQQIVSQFYLTDLPRTLSNTRGLGGIEYLLFYDGTDNGCPSTNAINTNGTWAAMDAAELLARKAGYARAAAADVLSRARALVDAWDPAGSNFRAELALAGAGSATYPTLQAAFNAVSDALFYIDTEVKDMKLAWPLDITICAGPCPSVAESPFAHRSKEHVRNNLIGFRLMFQGCDAGGAGLGFDDYLTGIGQSDLALDMRNRLAAAIAAVDAIEESSIEAGVASDRASVFALYDAVKALTDLLKTEFLGVLGLVRPMSAGDDND